MGIYRTILLIIILFFNLSFSQTLIGKIYTKDEANRIYGSILSSPQISTSILASLTNNTTNYIMFRIINGNLIILGDQRRPLFPESVIVSPQDEMKVFSVSLVRKIIADGNNLNTFIEVRNNNILTVTNGIYTLEFSLQCPPNCFDN
jgi:hypothetical protein